MLQPIGGELLMRVAPEVKRTLCKFFLAGTCERGELCTWAHGEQELGEPIGGLFNEQDVFRDDGLHVGKVGLAGFAGDPTMGPNAKRTICKFWEQGICKRGLECTFAHGVEDMQVDVQENLFEDLAPAQLPGSPSAGTKRTICKFWEEGACTKGEACTFAHGPEEIGAPIPVAFEPVLQGLGAPVGLGAIGKAPHAPPIVSTAPVISVHVKRTICKFWEQGTCTRGGECTWAHGEEELGAPVVMEPLEKNRPVPKQMQPIFSANVPATTGYVPAGKSGKGVIGKSVHGQKTVFQANPIERFDDHRFMPFEAPKGKGHQGKGKDIGSPLGSPLGSPIGFPGGKGAEQPLKKTICKFWLEGQCTRGQDCTWAHGVEDQAVPDHVALVGIPSGPPMAMGPTEVRRTICKFWQQGKCTQAAGQCTWAHGEWEIGTPVGAVSNKGGYQGGSVFKRPRLVH